MVLGNVEQIGCSHRGEIFVEKCTAKLLPWHCNGSIEQAVISDSVYSAIYINGVSMEQQNIGHAEKGDVLHKSVRQPLQHWSIAFADFLDNGVHPFRTDADIRGCDD